MESARFFSGDVLMDAVEEEAVTNQKTHQFLDFILRETKPYTLNKLMRLVSLPLFWASTRLLLDETESLGGTELAVSLESSGLTSTTPGKVRHTSHSHQEGSWHLITSSSSSLLPHILQGFVFFFYMLAK